MAFLRAYDYLKQIQDVNLQQIISSDVNQRYLAERLAQEEISSRLVQKYDISDEFRDTLIWSPLIEYKAKQLIELNYPTWSSTTNYVVDDLVIKNKKAFIAIQGGIDEDPEEAPTFWTLIGNQYDLFFMQIPENEFDQKKFYAIGDKVFWKDKVYTCKIATPVLDHNSALQFGSYSNLPAQNAFPDDPVEGINFWGIGVPYVIAAGTLPTDTNFWTLGDNRSQQLVSTMIDIVLYHLHSRIAPRNIPQLRIDRYTNAIEWLRDIARGEATAINFPLLKPKSGARIRFGGSIKNINSY